MSVRFPAALRATHRATSSTDIVEVLLDDIESIYEGITRKGEKITLRDLWHLAREITLSIERWARKAGDISGAEKLHIAREVAWDLLSWWGGEDMLRRAIQRQVEGRPFGVFTGSVLSRLLPARVLRKLVVFVLELAVAELRGPSAEPAAPTH